MRFRGKSRIDFEKWFEDQDHVIMCDEKLLLGRVEYKQLPNFILYSCYREWLRSVGIYTGRHDTISWWLFTSNLKYLSSEISSIDIKLKREVSTLEEAMKIYNNQSEYS
jgi:hypothetical protein